jgi:hypothetical protein
LGWKENKTCIIRPVLGNYTWSRCTAVQWSSCCCYGVRRCSWVLKTQQQTLRDSSSQTLCLSSKTMIYLWSQHSSYNRVQWSS